MPPLSKNPRNLVTTGYLDPAGEGKTWFPRGAHDLDGNPLNNGHTEIFIPTPGTTVLFPETFPGSPDWWNPWPK